MIDILKILDGAKSDAEVKAMDTATTAEGKEFVPTALATDLLERVRLAQKVTALFQPIDMPTDPYELPLEGADATAYKVAESTTETGTKPTESTPGTAKVTLDAVKLKARVIFSEEIQEDSVIPVLDYVKNKIALALTDAQEKAILDGDTAATHQDNDVTAADDARKSWNGLRKLALAQAATKVDLATFNRANLRAMRKAMKKYGINPADLAWIVGNSGYSQMLDLADVITVDKYGPNATLLTGELGRFDGVPIIVSEFVREDLNAAGVRDGVTTTKTYLLLVNRRRFLTGQRPGVSLKTFEDIETGQIKVVNGVRRDFKAIETTAAADPNVAIGFNLTA